MKSNKENYQQGNNIGYSSLEKLLKEIASYRTPPKVEKFYRDQGLGSLIDDLREDFKKTKVTYERHFF